VLFVILCRNHLFGFDGAKLRRFWVLAKLLREIVRANNPFFDEGQQIAVYLIILLFWPQTHICQLPSKPFKSHQLP
jgi:hypothetical protein